MAYTPWSVEVRDKFAAGFLHPPKGSGDGALVIGLLLQTFIGCLQPSALKPAQCGVI